MGAIMTKRRIKTYTWKDPGKLTLAVVVLLVINLIVLSALALSWLGLGEASLYADAAKDPAFEFTAPQFLRWSLEVLQSLVVLASVIIGFWLVRVSKNAHVLKPVMKYSPLGAVGWYFVPVAWWLKPFEAVSEIWDASSPKPSKRADRLLLAWWGCFVVSTFIASYGSFSGAGGWLTFVAHLLGVATTALFIVVVRTLGRMQREKHGVWLAAGQPVAPPSGPLQGIAQGDW
jgi:hypothetical protein